MLAHKAVRLVDEHFITTEVAFWANQHGIAACKESQDVPFEISWQVLEGI